METFREKGKRNSSDIIYMYPNIEVRTMLWTMEDPQVNYNYIGSVSQV